MDLTIGRARLEELLDAIAGTRIVTVGDAMLDEYIQGDVDRISPEAPVPVVRVRERGHTLGGAANVVHNIRVAGAEAALVAAVGRDTAGDRLVAMLGDVGADTAGVLRVQRQTTTKTRIMARGQQLVRIDEESDADLSDADARRIVESIEDALATAGALVLEDYNKGVLVPKVIRAAIDAARKRKLPVVVDPKYRHFFEYGGATVFKPNRRELESALGAAVDLEHPEAIPKVLQRLGVEHLLLTLSERGMLLVSANQPPRGVPTVAREVYDVVGAGDTVTAYLAAVLAAGGSAVEAAVIANYAAGVEVGKRGTATVTPGEVREAFDHFATLADAASSIHR